MGGAEDVAAVGADEAALAVEAAPVQRRALVRAGIHVGEGMVAVAHHEQRDLLRACAEDKAATLAIGNLGEAAERRAGEGMIHGERRSGAICWPSCPACRSASRTACRPAARPAASCATARKGGVWGKRVSVRVDPG